MAKRTELDILLKDKASKISSSPNCDGYRRGLASMVYKLFDKNSKGSGIAMPANKSTIKSMPNQQFPNELHKPVIRKRRVYSSFKNNIWDVGLADMQLISKYDKGIRYLLRAIDRFSKYAWVVLLKDNKGYYYC